MKRVYRLEDLDCAVCASKMETAIGRLEGVEKAEVSYLLQRLTIEAPEELQADILKKAKKAVKKIEPDCRIAEAL
ncbi:MAG: heavy metal-associated domain-containing protein [Ruminococcus sp.]